MVVCNNYIQYTHPYTNADKLTETNSDKLTGKNSDITFPGNMTTAHDLERVSFILDKCVRDKWYVKNKVPVHTLRAFILYYLRENSGQPLMWQTIAMGAVSNCLDLFADKKKSLEIWKESDPENFKIMETYLPRIWDYTDVFESEMNPDKLYVYKPVRGTGGNGIAFKKGHQMTKYVEDQTAQGVPSDDWVIQEFVDPFLWNNKKTHMRSISLLIIQPSGEREFYIYNKLRLFTAPLDYSEEALLDSEVDNQFMLLTNIHQNHNYFKLDPASEGKVWDPTTCLIDVEEGLGSGESSLTFDHVFYETKRMQTTMYSIVGDLLECKGTKTSIYDHACFHLLGTDIAIDKDGDLYFLEVNTAMHWNPWTDSEISDILRGSAGLFKGTETPFDTSDTDLSMWTKMDV